MTLAAAALAVPAMMAQDAIYVNLAFTGDNLPEEAYKGVTVLDITQFDDEGDPMNFPVNSDAIVLPVEKPYGLVFAPNEDYAIMDLVITDAEENEVSYEDFAEMGLIQQATKDEFGEDEEAGFIYTLGIYPIEAVNGYTFTFVLNYLGEVKEPDVQQSVNVTINYIGDYEKDTYTYVYTFFEEFSGKFEAPEEPEVDSDSFNFACVPAVGVSFEPIDGYYLEGVTTVPAESEYLNVQGGKYQRSVTLLQGFTG